MTEKYERAVAQHIPVPEQKSKNKFFKKSAVTFKKISFRSNSPEYLMY